MSSSSAAPLLRPSRLRQPAPRLSSSAHNFTASSWPVAPPNTPVIHERTGDHLGGKGGAGEGRRRGGGSELEQRRRSSQDWVAQEEEEAGRPRRSNEISARAVEQHRNIKPPTSRPRAFLVAPPNTPQITSQLPRRSGAAPHPRDPLQTSVLQHVARSGSIRKRASMRRNGVATRAGVAGVGKIVSGEERGRGSSTVGQVGLDQGGGGGGGGGRSRIPEPPSTARERLRPTRYHHDGSSPRRPILEPPSSYSSSFRNGHPPPHRQSKLPPSPRQTSTIPTRRPSQRHRSIRPPSSSTQPHRSRGIPSKSSTHLSPSLPSSSSNPTSHPKRLARPPLPHFSFSESLLRITIPATSPLGLSYRGPPPVFHRGGGETSSSESGPDEAKLLWAELERRLGANANGNEEKPRPRIGSKEWVRKREAERERQRTSSLGVGMLGGVSLAELTLHMNQYRDDQAERDFEDSLLQPPAYPSATFSTAAQWSPLATVGLPLSSFPRLPTVLPLPPLSPHSPCPRIAHPSPRPLPGLSPLLHPTFDVEREYNISVPSAPLLFLPSRREPEPVALVVPQMERLDSHVVRTLRGLEAAFLDDGSSVMAGRLLAGMHDVVDLDQEEDLVSKEQRRRLIWQESYRRTGSWRNETLAATQVRVGEPLNVEGSKSSNGSSGFETDYSTDETANEKASLDLGGGRDDKKTSPNGIIRDTKLDLQRDLKLSKASSDDALAGLGLLNHHDLTTTASVLPALSFLSASGGLEMRQGDPRSRLSTLTTSTNSSGSASASSSRTSSSFGTGIALSIPPPLSTTSSTLSTESQQYLLRIQTCSTTSSSPLLLPAHQTRPHMELETPLFLSFIPDSPLLSLPTPELPSNASIGFSSPGLRPLSLPIKYNLADGDGKVVLGRESRRISLGGGGGRRRVVTVGGNSGGRESGKAGEGGGGGNRAWRVFGGGGEEALGEGIGATVMVWK